MLRTAVMRHWCPLKLPDLAFTGDDTSSLVLHFFKLLDTAGLVGIESTKVVNEMVTPAMTSWAIARPIGTAVTSTSSRPC